MGGSGWGGDRAHLYCPECGWLKSVCLCDIKRQGELMRAERAAAAYGAFLMERDASGDAYGGNFSWDEEMRDFTLRFEHSTLEERQMVAAWAARQRGEGK